MSTLKVDGIRSNSASSDAITLASDGTCTANITNNLSNRNLIINGAMQVAQRSTSSTTSGYGSVDRFRPFHSGTDEAPTQAHVSVDTGTTPFSLGLKTALKITNGNQTSGAGTADVIEFATRLEAQDLATSGWNYTSTSSYITLSFWVKSSVAQNFYGQLVTTDGTSQNYPFETGSLTANTWTKVTKTIPGNANLTFDNNTDKGIDIKWIMYRGTNTTGSVSLNAWAANDNSVRTPDSTSTWYTTNDATFEITGVQLEVSDHATDFEHRSFGQELALCQRYFFTVAEKGANHSLAFGQNYNTATAFYNIIFPVRMRATPTLDQITGTNYYQTFSNGSAVHFNEFNSVDTNTANTQRCELRRESLSVTQGAGNFVRYENANAEVRFTAEL